MRSLSWIISVPAAILAVVFAVSNREPVTLALWPFAARLAIPAYLVVLVPLGAGLLLGALAASAGAWRARFLARRRAARIAELTAELGALRQAAAPTPPALR